MFFKNLLMSILRTMFDVSTNDIINRIKEIYYA